jgi:hypothetical protein
MAAEGAPRELRGTRAGVRSVGRQLDRASTSRLRRTCALRGARRIHRLRADSPSGRRARTSGHVGRGMPQARAHHPPTRAVEQHRRGGQSPFGRGHRALAPSGAPADLGVGGGAPRGGQCAPSRVAIAAAGFSANVVVLILLMAVAGLFVVPALATAYLAADEAAPPHARTRAGAWGQRRLQRPATPAARPDSACSSPHCHWLCASSPPLPRLCWPRRSRSPAAAETRPHHR